MSIERSFVLSMFITENKAALNTHLIDILKVASTQDLTPDINTLVKAKRYQVSGVGLNR